jgi:hypothetical protein
MQDHIIIGKFVIFENEKHKLYMEDQLICI